MFLNKQESLAYIESVLGSSNLKNGKIEYVKNRPDEGFGSVNAPFSQGVGRSQQLPAAATAAGGNPDYTDAHPFHSPFLGQPMYSFNETEINVDPYLSPEILTAESARSKDTQTRYEQDRMGKNGFDQFEDFDVVGGNPNGPNTVQAAFSIEPISVIIARMKQLPASTNPRTNLMRSIMIKVAELYPQNGFTLEELNGIAIRVKNLIKKMIILDSIESGLFEQQVDKILFDEPVMKKIFVASMIESKRYEARNWVMSSSEFLDMLL